MKDRNELKKKLKSQCYSYLEKILDTTQEAIKQSQISANEETKSSSGDKYETGRSMAQLEIEKLTGQLENTKKLINQLEKLDPTLHHTQIKFGSIVITNEANYFISIPAGKLYESNEYYYSISIEAPIAKAFLGQSKGDVRFNNKTISILEIA